MGAAPVHLDGYDGLVAAVGTELGTSCWLTVDQPSIDSFAALTGDHAWIHVDPERAAHGPFGGTIAHGLLILSLVTALAGQVFRVGGLQVALHYGYDRVRFVRPVAEGSRIRARVTLALVNGDATATRALYHVEVEQESSGLACAADMIYFYAFVPSE